MKKIVLALAAIVLFASGASASDLQPIFQQYEQYETACSNFIATLDYSRNTLVYSYIKRICMDGVFEDTEFVAEWGSKKQDQLEKALSECRTSATDLRSCLALELKKLERQ
jgi:opacity protein-like surface antigen